MSHVVIDLRIMPESPDEDLEKIKTEAIEKIKAFEGNIIREEIQPIAFGLNAIILTFGMNEAKGDTEPLEKDIASIKGVNSVEVTGARRAFG